MGNGEKDFAKNKKINPSEINGAMILWVCELDSDVLQ